jgi:hypothetical protein
LSCLSCPPTATPTSNAVISNLAEIFNSPTSSGWSYVTTPGRAMSPDGGRVFFDTRNALVPQDVNGTGDVYEWEDGKLYLISSGHDPSRSMFAGISESGADAFIMTAEGISPGDTDGSYDVYDARIPRPGDSPPAATPCEGAVCQGPPSVPQLLSPPASEAFNGAGNLTPAPASHAKPKSLTRAQKLARALKACRRGKNAHRRKKCERQARRKYGAKSAIARQAGGQAHHRNGRGN